MRDARTVALMTLCAVEEQGAWANGTLKKELARAKLDRRDAALATRLCFGTLQTRMQLDFYLQAFSNMPLQNMEASIRNTLRLALYQILYMERIPHTAAVHEAVSLAKRHGKHPKASGMVNGILRNLLRHLDSLPMPRKKDALSIQYSHPHWLIGVLHQAVPKDEVEALMQAHQNIAPTTLQVNTLRCTQEALQARLQAEGVESRPHACLPNCLLVESLGNLEQLTAFSEGLCYVQDPAAALAVWASGAKPDMRVLDVCAAPGGKSFGTAIALQNQGSVTSCDLYEHKKTILEEGAKRLGLTCLSAEVRDARIHEPTWVEQFDLLLADVPCSGLGVIRKKPEIRYKDPDAMADLLPIQSDILDNVCRYVKRGGVLLYATCTIRREENEDQVTAFLQRHPEFHLEGFSLPLQDVPEGFLTLLPHKHDTDGFFIAKLRRQL